MAVLACLIASCKKDHYDMDSLRLAEEYHNIQYVFSKDIRISPNFLKKHGIDPKVREKVTFVKPGQNVQLNNLMIKTLASTDAGVAFYINLNGVSVFHSGDLGYWRMEGAGDLMNGKMKRSYRHEIRKLTDMPINLAFVPMDPRLGSYQFSVIDYFMKHTDAEFVFPMHMWQDYTGISEYKNRISNLGMANRIMEISRENQVFPFLD